jgi:hypothetical protein
MTSASEKRAVRIARMIRNGLSYDFAILTASFEQVILKYQQNGGSKSLPAGNVTAEGNRGSNVPEGV